MSNLLLDVLEVFRNDITTIGDRPMTPEKIDFIIAKLRVEGQQLSTTKQPTPVEKPAVPDKTYTQSRLSL
jgi:hypothetical protein